MRKPTRAELEARAAEGALAEAVLHLALTSKPDAVERFKVDGSTYTYELFGSIRSYAGIVIQRFHVAGQNDSIKAMRFDDWANRAQAMPFGSEFAVCEKGAAERLRAARNALLNA